ncbi:nuclear transport factor 2 family protein [Candidatus Lokiarchaeum ossiferum]|uniref:nuclear transport factor 2 family protein n=1 Tax=Candidatus Lokiarchaeum ossiferum TaxID=2951803 RepID=UPI00352DAB50
MNANEIDDIKKVIRNYVTAVQTMNFNLVRSAWDTDGHRWIIDPDTQEPYKMLSASHEDVIKSIKHSSGPSFTADIISVEYTGTAAFAKIAWHSVDETKIGEINYILLLKTKSGWKIVSKNAHRF